MATPVAARDRADAQSTAFEAHIGERVRIATRIDLTPAGLLAIGGMVSMILLSSAAIVRAALSRRG